MKTKLFLLLIGCILENVCFATETNFQSQFELNQQSLTEFKKADQQLQKICSDIRSKLDTDGQKKFDASQTAWLIFRKAEAESYADQYRGGSIYPLIYAGSMTDSTERRIAQLQIQLDDLKRR